MADKQNMTNAAYDEKYLKKLKESDKYFIQTNFQYEEERQLSNNITAIIKYYVAADDKAFYLSGADVVFIKDGKEIYKYRCYNDDATFDKIIHHSNGKDYILFRRDLYGYSVLELDTLKDFHYYPACHLKPKGAETFIWCDPIYNPNNDLLAVFGCYWACPNDLAIVDFKDPFMPAENQVCILFKKDIGDIVYEEGYSWQKNTLVILSKHSKKPKIPKGVSYCYNDIKDKIITTKKTHRITEALCRKWLTEGNDF